MDYIKNKYSSAIFFIINVFIYFSLSIFLNLNGYLENYIIFFILFITYYLVDIFDFEDSRYKFKMFIYSSIVNIGFCILSYFWTRKIEVLFLYLGLYMIQNISKYVILEIFLRNKNVLIIGDNYKNDLICKMIETKKVYDIVGTLSDGDQSKSKIIGTLKEVKEIARIRKVNKIIIVEESIIEQAVINDLLDLKLNGIPVYNFFDFYEKIEEKIPVKVINEEWFLFGRGFGILHNNFQKRLKRVIDFILGILIFILAFPIMIFSIIVIKLESKGSVLFVQERIGIGNKPFKIYKFRSMKLHDPEKHSKYAGENDNRITNFGGFMRKTRIDELPQLFNVLKGEMSFIGPRAEWDKLCYGYMEEIPFYNLRHSVKPGLTGWAQVNYPYGASVEDAFEKLQYDLYYIKHQSFVLDIVIFLKTIKTVLFGKGR